MKLKRIHRDFSVCQVEDYSLVNLESEYCFIGKTDEERSLVCAESEVPSNVIKREDGWKAICICGVLDFSLIGILSEIAAVLAAEGVRSRAAIGAVTGKGDGCAAIGDHASKGKALARTLQAPLLN